MFIEGRIDYMFDNILWSLPLIREGKFAEARPYWAKAVELAPAKASYRGQLMMRLILLDRFLQAQAAEAGQGQPRP